MRRMPLKITIQKIRCLAIALMAFWGMVMPASAQISLAGQDDSIPVRLSLISAISATGKGSSIPLGLKAELDDGWKIYWRSPGDAGLPPIITLEDGQPYQLELAFPVPKRFSLFDIDSFGYADEVIFPIILSGHNAGEALELRGTAEGLVCSDICIPFSAPIEIYLPSGTAQPSDHAQSLAKAISLVPKRQSSVLKLGWQQGKLVLGADSFGASLEGRLEDVFVETGLSGVSFGAPAQDGNSYLIEVTGTDYATLATSQITLTLVTNASFAEFGAEIFAASDQENSNSSLFWMLIISFFGGLILNVMPCVLPVLMLKLNSIILAQSAPSAMIRLRLLSGAGGIIVSFFILGCIFVLLSVSGRQLGWGIQFQNPVFLSVMAVMITLFALSLFDRISLPIPQFLHRQVAVRSTLLQDFMSGFLATALATPCSAPLVGTAISFAFTSPPIMLMSVLMMMGFGLASPWLLGALFPVLIKTLPRPGRWMNSVKMAMGFGLVGTVFWLIWLIYLQTGNVTSLMLVLLLLGVCASLYFRQRLLVVVCVVSAVIAPSAIAPYFSSAGSEWQGEVNSRYAPFSQPRLSQALASDQIVFVDVTAEWCITCKVNKKLVLDSETIIQAFDSYQVELIRADWTVANPEISDFLIAYDRFGIPFNIVFAAGATEFIILPELLSIDSVISALERLAKQG